MTAAPAGHHHADLHAVVAADGIVWLFWALHVGSNWCIVSARWDGETWSLLETIADGPGGNREPWAVLDQTNRIWVFWARRQGVGTLDGYLDPCRRVFDPVTGTWDAEAPVTTRRLGAGSRSRTQCRTPADGDLRVFFRSDRAGGADLWSITVSPATGEAVGPPSASPPTPLRIMPQLHFSCRAIRCGSCTAATAAFPSHGWPPGCCRWRTASLTSQGPEARMTSHCVSLRSARMDTGTLRRFAGTTSVVLSDAARISRHRLWDDLLAYTPQQPLGLAPGEVLPEDVLYTRGRWVCIKPGDSGHAFNRQMVDGCVRCWLASTYQRARGGDPGATARYRIRLRTGVEIGEAYQDRRPTIEFFTGLGEDTNAPRLSFDWSFVREYRRPGVGRSRQPDEFTAARVLSRSTLGRRKRSGETYVEY